MFGANKKSSRGKRRTRRIHTFGEGLDVTNLHEFVGSFNFLNGLELVAATELLNHIP
jgi:hypothetical protein